MKSVNEQALISVIVPVYKVESYLDKCVESIVNQSYKNLEIILVDDGSTDNCPAMCDEWAKKDSRIKVIHKANGGVSRARNLGKSVASGEYVAFVDSDDWLHPEFFQSLYSAVTENNAEISACKLEFTQERDCSFFEIEDNDFVKLYSPEEALRTFSDPAGFSAGPCNKLYRRDMLEGEEFVADKRHEDEFFTYKIIAKANKLAFVDLGLYYYYQHGSSFMHSVSEQHLDFLEAMLEQISFYKSRFPKLYVESKSGFCISCINYYIAVDELPDDVSKKCKKRIKDYRNLVKFTFAEFEACDIKHKIYILLSKRLIGITSKIFMLIRKGRQ